MNKFTIAAVTAGVLAVAASDTLKAQTVDAGVPSALATINGTLSAIQATLKQVTTSLAGITTTLGNITTSLGTITAGITPSTTIMTGARFATTSAGCILANAGTSPVTLLVAPARVIGGDIVPPNSFTLSPTPCSFSARMIAVDSAGYEATNTASAFFERIARNIEEKSTVLGG